MKESTHRFGLGHGGDEQDHQHDESAKPVPVVENPVQELPDPDFLSVGGRVSPLLRLGHSRHVILPVGIEHRYLTMWFGGCRLGRGVDTRAARSREALSRLATKLKKLGKTLIVIGIISLIAGFGTLIVGTTFAVKGFQHCDVPGTADLRLSQPGRYRIYAENRDSMHTEITEVTVTDPSGPPLDVETDTSEHFSMNGDSWDSVGSFAAPEAGTYRIDSRDTAGGRLAIGRETHADLYALVGVGAGFVLLILGSFISPTARSRWSAAGRGSCGGGGCGGG